jgi:hypothetical protein
MKKRIIAYICSILVLSCTLSGCGDEVETYVMEPYDLSVSYSDTFTSAEACAVQFQNYIRAGYWNLAFSLINMSDDVLLSAEGFNTAENEISELPDDWVLYDVSKTSSGVKLTYGEKISEAYSRGKDGTYIGDVVDYVLSIDIPIVEGASGGYAIGVKDKWVSQDVIALKVPDYCSVRIGGKLLDDTSRDDAGYYLITHFVNGDTLSVELGSAVESKTIVLNRKSSTDNGDTSDDDTTMINSAGQHMGYPAYVVTWETSRITNAEALEFAESAVQKVFTGICNQEDFYTANFINIMGSNANLEAMKPYYIKAQSSYENTARRIYKDLTVVSLTSWDDDTMRRKGVSWCMQDRDTMSIWVDLSYSYVIETIETGEVNVRTGDASGEITLTKENGEWKLLGISDKILKAIV